MRLAAAVLMFVLVSTVLALGVPPGAVRAQDETTATAVAPGTVIVDELSAGFRQRGGDWRSAPFGYAGHHYWLPASRTQRRIGIWSATLPEPGLYRVMAKLPGRHASTRAAVYKVKTASGWQQRVRNQYKHRGSWLSLGIHEFGTTAEVRLGDQTRDPRGTNRKLAFDALKFVPVVPPAPPVITRLEVTPGIDRAVVTFSLDEPGPARTQYREAGSTSWITGVNEPSSKVKDHRHVIRGLMPETDYELRVIATNLGGRTISPVVSFTTLAPPPPPTISDLDVDPRHDRAIVTFSLDEPGPARTQYRRAGASDWLLGANETSSKYADHRQVIRDLMALTDYELRVIATNDWGRTISPVVGFTTLAPPPPVITDIVVNPEDTRAVVTFSLDAAGPARTEYREAGATGWTVGAEETSSKYKDHRQVIRGLVPETQYELRVVATNAGGRTVSDVVPFTTRPRLVDCGAGEDLQDAIDAARPGNTIRIKGTCVSGGGFGIDRDLSLRGVSDDAALRAAYDPDVGLDHPTVLSIGAYRRVSVSDLRLFTIGYGIWNSGDVTVDSCTLEGGDRSGIENQVGARITVRRSRISGFKSMQALGILNGGELRLIDSTVSSIAGNGAISNGSVATVSGSVIENNSSILGNDGGGISNSGALTIESSVVRNNDADGRGGGIYNSGRLTLVDGRVTGNSAGDGGGIYNTGTVSVAGTVIRDNTPNDCVGC